MTIADRRPALETFGEALQFRRLERDWTQRRLAEEVGVSRQTVLATLTEAEAVLAEHQEIRQLALLREAV